MQLKFKRSMEMKGLVTKKAVFGTNFRVEYSEEERAAINAYNLGGDVVYHTDKLHVTIRSLKDGHYVECPELAILLNTETAIHEACKNLKNYLEIAKTFNGQDVVLEI